MYSTPNECSNLLVTGQVKVNEIPTDTIRPRQTEALAWSLYGSYAPNGGLKNRTEWSLLQTSKTANKNKAAATCVAHTAGSSLSTHQMLINRLIVAWRSEDIANHSSYK